MAFRMSTTKEDTIVHTRYTLSGEFAQTPFGQPAELLEAVTKTSYFASLVESIEVGYRYRFVPGVAAGHQHGLGPV